MHDDLYRAILESNEKSKEDKAMSTCLGCSCYTFLFLFSVVVGGFSANYLLLTFTGKVIPFFWAMVLGGITSPISIPTAIAVWILKTFGIL